MPRTAYSGTVHRRRGADGEVVQQWTQRALSVSRIMPTWRDMVVRDRLLMEEASTPYLQRGHYRTRETGFAAAAASSAGPKAEGGATGWRVCTRRSRMRATMHDSGWAAAVERVAVARRGDGRTLAPWLWRQVDMLGVAHLRLIHRRGARANARGPPARHLAVRVSGSPRGRRRS